jgi:predicted enzyme related to lactoylglutathione lyase
VTGESAGDAFDRVRMLSISPVWLVSDVPASCEELRNLFGFDIRPYFTPPGEPTVYGIVERESSQIHVSRAPDGRPRAGRPFKPEHCDAYIFVADVDALYEQILSRGANVVQPPRVMPYPIKEMHVALRDGFVLAFGEPVSAT